MAELVASFGTPARNRFTTGVMLAATDGLVRASSAGEIIFAADENRKRSALPSILGSFVALEHEGGMIGLYAGMEGGTVSSYLARVKPGDLLGRTGASGPMDGEGLYFSVFDRKAARWVNPLLLLPKLAESRPPIVRSAALVGTSRTWILGDSRPVPQGTYSVAIDVFDPTSAAWSMGPSAPYSIRLVVDGVKIVELIFDIASERDGRLSLFSSIPKDYAAYRHSDGRIILGSRLFYRGKALVEVYVSDYAGNERSFAWSVVIE